MDQTISYQQPEYIHGYSPEHQAFLSQRTAEHDAAFFLPQLKSGMRLLDCGCGMGALTASLAEYVAPGEVIGIDRDPGQVDVARTWTAQKGIHNVRFEVSNIEHIPYPEASFDAVFALTVLEHVKDPLSVLREMRRLLKPGGVAGIQDPDYGLLTQTPSLPQVDELIRWMIGFHEENGSPYYARHLRRYMLDAGFTRAEGFAACIGGGNDQMVNFNYELVIKPTIENLRSWIKQSGLADDTHIDACLIQYKTWCQRPDSFFALPLFAAVGWV